MSKTELNPRYCPRCKLEVFDEPGEHLCADLAKRLARRNRQVDEVMLILHLNRHLIMGDEDGRMIAQEIVRKLANLGVEDDI